MVGFSKTFLLILEFETEISTHFAAFQRGWDLNIYISKLI